MVVTDPSIDPITGLPVLNPSGSVQQIPLGQNVFPYEDLNATAQPTRGPIYGDDIIPTSGLVTAPDVQMKPRSIQSTTTRELRVREAVFQNLGAAIPDGTTAPVDVNVVHGGGGGGGVTPAVMNESAVYTTSITSGPFYNVAFIGPLGNTLYGYSVGVSWGVKMGLTYNDGSFRLFIQGFDDNAELTLVYGQVADYSVNASGYSSPFNETVMYPVPRDITAFLANNPNGTSLIIEGTASTVNIAVRVWTS